MNLLEEINKTPKEIEVEHKSGSFSFMGLCLRYKTSKQLWAVYYGNRTADKDYVGWGENIEDAFLDFQNKQLLLKKNNTKS